MTLLCNVYWSQQVCNNISDSEDITAYSQNHSLLLALSKQAIKLAGELVVALLFPPQLLSAVY